MPHDAETPEERLADLLAELPPAPTAWVDEAAALPRVRREADRLVALCEADAAFRAAVLADLEGALAGVGVEPTPELVAELRGRKNFSGVGEDPALPGVW
ncbi:MAG: hypothetical protein AVDCRST_MAG13-2388 [uncultured Solirubrobacteraceae bacterium]|uniref:Uncharacterized protein n=1 Tax=uncultured Solirubrobacteraceae bacterium TaxID=1162706 RepID=A0A6J4SRK1_9ACTN|nr:MAG: hypothetical protein AVDCRST_MAG13-2388 [uncultured Solirubrobacteraceae bacterium]